MSRLWILEIADYDKGGFGYDCNEGFVISAPSEAAARALAENQGGDELDGAWLDVTITTCEELLAGETQVELRSFNAG